MSLGWSLIIDFVAVLTGAFLLGTVMERIRQSAVLGYIAAGVILGPGALGVVRDVEAVRAISEIGVALLLFTIGLEFSWRSIRKLGRTALFGGPVQILSTMALTWAIALAIGVDAKQAFVAGSVLALSSTAVVLKALKDRGDLDAPHGKASLGILLVQDVALIPLVLLLSLISGEPGAKTSLADLGPLVSQIALGAIAIVVVASLFLPRVFSSRAMARNRELPILMAVVTCIGAAWGAHTAGFSPSLGAFLAGMVLAETSYSDQIRADVAPLRALFATLFFVSIGMLADVGWLANNAFAVLLLTVVLVLGKAATTTLSVRAFGMTTIAALATGFCLAQVGELSFVLLQMGVDRGVIEGWVGQLLTSSSILSLALCPYLVGAAPRLSRSIAKSMLSSSKLIEELARDQSATPDLRNHVIVVGFGESGKAAAQVLESSAKVLVLDIDRRLVQKARQLGYAANVGDATQQEILERASPGCAKGIVIALSDHRSCKLCASLARRLAPELPIIARARYHLFADEIDAAGADRVVDEEALVGVRLGEEMLVQLGLHWDEKGEGLQHPELH